MLLRCVCVCVCVWGVYFWFLLSPAASDLKQRTTVVRRLGVGGKMREDVGFMRLEEKRSVFGLPVSLRSLICNIAA